jgi:hypothetical protein
LEQYGTQLALSHESQNQLENDRSLVIRGREFTSEDLEIIYRCVNDNFDKGRTYISKQICEELNWKQPNGWLKDRACRDVLLQLEAMELIELPLSLTTISSVTPSKKKPLVNPDTYDFSTPLNIFPQSITFEIAKSNKSELKWNEIINQYHYLGHKVAVGRCIKYLIKTEDNLIGAIAFSSPAWRLAPRDSLLEKLGYDIDGLRNQVINNSRFLILPNAHLKNLASTVLSLATKQIVDDWVNYYSIKPIFAETFVQPSLFKGICYQAANWIEVGITKGYAKNGNSYHNSQEQKKIYLYGLERSARKRLLKAFLTIKKEAKEGRD